MSIISSLFSSAAGAASGYFEQYKLIFKTIVATLIIAVILGTVYYVHSLKKDIKTLTDDKNVLIANNSILKQNTAVLSANVKTCQSANTTNLDTIQKLTEERADSIKAINNLAASTLSDRKTISNLNAKLDDLLKDPKNDGIVSPALRETVRNIQRNTK